MFPYPSSSGLHVGHPEGYTATDILSRYKRARGFNVLHPMGWDAFGLPAEQYALQTGVHPAITTGKAIETFRRQLKSLGFSYDWSREVRDLRSELLQMDAVHFPEALRARPRLSKRKSPSTGARRLKTVLANEEVVDGKSERGGHPVYRQPMKQWMLKITSMPSACSRISTSSIGRRARKSSSATGSAGAKACRLVFKIDGHERVARNFHHSSGHDLGRDLHGARARASARRQRSRPRIARREVESLQGTRPRRNPSSRARKRPKKKPAPSPAPTRSIPRTGEKIPIWIADYVMMGYGTGAIMAVPGARRRATAISPRRFDLSIRRSRRRPGAKRDARRLLHRRRHFDQFRLHHRQAHGESQGRVIQLGGKRRPRQAHDPVQTARLALLAPALLGRAVSDPASGRWHAKSRCRRMQLPVVLPDVKSYEPTGTGESPLAAITEWVNTVDSRRQEKSGAKPTPCPEARAPAGISCATCDPHNDKEPVQPRGRKILDARRSLSGRPRARGRPSALRALLDQGSLRRRAVHPRRAFQETRSPGDDPRRRRREDVEVPRQRHQSRHVVEKYGADTLRMYEMFMGPLDRDKPWSTHGDRRRVSLSPARLAVFSRKRDRRATILVDDANRAKTISRSRTRRSRRSPRTSRTCASTRRSAR